MDKLIAIAKECGASDFIGNDYRDLPKVIFTHEQLHATIEQVCAPLVETLQAIKDRTNRKEFAARNLDKQQLNELLDMVGVVSKQALTDHRAIMGDKK